MTEQSHNILCERFQTLSLSNTLSKAHTLAHHLHLLAFCADFNTKVVKNAVSSTAATHVNA